MSGRAAWAAWAAIAAAPACASVGGFGLPLDASAEGWRVDRLFASTHVLIAIVAAIAFGVLAYAIIRFRAPARPHYTHGTSRRAIAFPLAAAVFVLVVVDGNLFLTSTRDLGVLGDARAMAEKPDAVRIQLTARQWSWEARYEGTDGEFGTDRDVVVTDHLRVPIGRPVVVQLASVDVVHALNLPNFRVKLQAIPGRINMVWFQAERLGRYEIACAQHCGAFHYKMRGELDVLGDEAFEAWLERESADAARARREAARAAAEEPRRRELWPVWRETPLVGAWSWEDGLHGEGAPPKRDPDEGGGGAMSSLARMLFSTDHKLIAKRYLWAGLVFLALGGALAMVMRWQWAHPGQPVPLVGALLFPGSDGAVTPASYTSLFTNHGLVMIFFAVTPILIGCFGNFCIPLMIGAREMAFPRLNAATFWIFALSQALALASMLMPQGAAASGWTMYPPMSVTEAEPGPGQTVMIAAIFTTGIATILGAVNFVTTVLTKRAPGMTMLRLPLTVWGLWLTSILSALFVPVLGVASLMLFLDRVAGTQFFIAGAAGTGDPLLYQHLFWIFGHPEVYILILPVWGILGDLIATFARKPAFWYRGTVGAMCTVAGMSGLVYGHHMFQTGMGPMLGTAFEALTLAISAPAVVLYVNWLCTLWRGSIRFTVPMLFSLGTVFVFGAGGLTGLYLGAITTDIHLHDSMWVVGHFHLIMAAATFLGSFAAIYFWFPKMFGRELGRRLGVLHFGGTFVLVVITFSLMLLAGYAGQPRRLYDPYQYEFLAHLAGINTLTTYAAFALGAFQLLFVANLVLALVRGRPAEANPWQATTLEWTLPSPAPEPSFAVAPQVRRGPHELGSPRAQAALGRDYLDQREEEPA